ncbi:MAG: hypothetical protein JNL06_18995 [Alphaproteobacteria bacterium]|nr:hypothetical protein [Alphaproteobacteria bacterium]
MRYMHPVYWLALILFLGCAAPTTAAAQECTDLLPEKPGFQPKEISSNRFLTSLAFAYLKTASYRDRNRMKLLGASFPAGDAILGSAFPAVDYDAFQRSLARFDFSPFDDQVAVALSSGDKRIVKAWQDCMATRTGLMMWFTPNIADPKQAVLNLRWAAANPHAPREIELSETLVLKGVTVTQGKHCLQRGNAITRAGCSATLRADSYETGFVAGLNSEDGYVEAYWPPRWRLELESSTYDRSDLVTVDHAFTQDHSGAPGQESLSMRPKVALGGWQFVPSTLNLWSTVRKGKELGTCKPGRAHIDEQGIIQVIYNAENISAKPPQALVCAWYADTRVMRTVDREAAKR